MATAFQFCPDARVTVCIFSTERPVFAGGKAVITSYMRLSASRLLLLSTFFWDVIFVLFYPFYSCVFFTVVEETGSLKLGEC